MTITNCITFVGDQNQYPEEYNALTVIRNGYISYFTQSCFYGTPIKAAINHHGEFFSHTYNFIDFKQITKKISGAHDNFALLVAGREGIELVKNYRPPEHVTITWVGTELPSQATKNIHRWYVPKQLLTDGAFNEVTSCKHHYIGLPTQKTENNTYIFDDNSSLDKTINDDLKTNGFQRDRPWVDRFSMYSKRACQHSCTKPAITNIDNIDASYGKSSDQARHLATTTRLDY